MNRLLAAPIAELLIFNFPLHELLVLAHIVVAPFADGAAKGDQSVCAFYLSHGDDDTTPSGKRQTERSRQ